MFHCSRCGRRYPSKLEMQEIRRPNGQIEAVCRHCLGTSRCEVCGFTSAERKQFGIRKVEGKWRVVCVKCIAGPPAPPAGPRRGGK